MIQFTIGADPEVFVHDGKEVLPAHLFTNGTKEAPEEIEPGFNVHFDNISLEFNIPPSSSSKEFQRTIKHGLDICEDVVGWNNDILVRSAVRLQKEQIEKMGDPVMMFRCDPEDNIWGDRGYPDQDPLVRSAGGHIHIGWGSHVPETQQDLVAQWCDAIIGLELCLLDDDSAPLRRTMYGKPGAIRRKPYGIEYRTPSNQWLLSPAYQDMLYGCVSKTLEFAMRGPFPFVEHINSIKKVINTSNKKQAQELINFFKGAL